MNSTHLTEPVTRHRLVGFGDWATMKPSLVQRVFGHLVRLATPVVEEYHSDLYWDAINLEAVLDRNLNQIETGTSFLYAVRTSGTNMEESALCSAEIGSPGLILYRITVEVDERMTWWIEIEDETNNVAALREAANASR